ncbi:Glycine-rich cell wall structural protein 1.8 precursor [Candidatus Burkholderia humilis]|nr:Glycine-rich cell wall structural protein 1.8 precursor [Candidatus Burkholderia humilis]
MKTAVAGILLASSAALLTGCAAYPDAPGYGGGYASPVYDEPGYGYYGPPVAQPNVVFGSGYYYGPRPGRYWDDGPGWRGRPPGYWNGGPPPPPAWGGGRVGGQVPQSVGGVRPRPPAPAANNGGGGGNGGGGRSRGGAPMNGSVQPLQH